MKIPKTKKDKRAYLDISFSWIFGLIIGGFILFGAIYGVTKFINLEESKTSGEGATEFSVLLNPLELGVETGKSIYLKMPVESRVNLKCNSVGLFGTQTISIDEYIRNRWTNAQVEVYLEDKYIFSDSVEEGKGFYAFSKDFEYPFKISSLIYLTSENDAYCFVDPPAKIKKEIENIAQPNIKTGTACQKDAITVCFEKSGCDISVAYSQKIVKKTGKTLYFETDALMYGAIFSDARTYECQASRLMSRVKILTEIYEEKALAIIPTGCVSQALGDLGNLRTSLSAYNSSRDLAQNYQLIKNLETKNNGQCKLW